MADNFTKDHGYAKGTYENMLAGQGYNIQQLKRTGKYGKNINPDEYTKILGTVKSPYQEALDKIRGDQFAWNPNDYLPQIQQTADAIYVPQKSQLEVLRQLTSFEAENKRIQTNEDFASRMQQEIESINRRGAFFSGGAIQNEQNLRTEQARTLQMLDLQAQAANFANIAQQAGLSAQQAEYIQDALFNKESSAYKRFQDERNFQMDALTQEQNVRSSAATNAVSSAEWSADYDLTYDKWKATQ